MRIQIGWWLWISFVITPLLATSLPAGIVTLEDVGAGLAPNGFYNGGPTDNNAGWISGGVHFNNNFTDFGGGFSGWEGWAYSNVQDITTAGFGNQYAAYSESGIASGFGADHSPTYALAFTGAEQGNNGSVLNFSTATQIHSVALTNTTYAVRAFRDGVDGFGFAAKFVDGDFLRLFITGFAASNASGNSTGSVAFDLANYGGVGAADDFYLRDWTNLDLSALGQVRSLRFSLDSNVVDVFGANRFLNTPSYVAVDNLSFTAVPEPSSLGLVCLAGLIVGARGRRRASVARQSVARHSVPFL